MNARVAPNEEHPMHSKEGGPCRKRRRMDEKASPELDSIAETHQSHHIHEGCGIGKAGILRFRIIIGHSDAYMQVPKSWLLLIQIWILTPPSIPQLSLGV